MHKPTYIFHNRYRITGTLTALSPIHVGDGGDADLNKRNTILQPDAPDTKYSTFATGERDGRECILIPGSAIKGVLRSWLRRHAADTSPVDNVFGAPERAKRETDPPTATGGKAEFHDSPLCGVAPGTGTDRWWDGSRGTCLAPGVSLDPHTKTAKEHLLYYTEFAPEGTAFKVTVTAQDLTPAEISLIVSAFDAGFKDKDDPIRLGAETADGWGALSWRLDTCEIIQPDYVRQWLDEGAPKSYLDLYRQVAPPPASAFTGARDCVLLDIALQFEGALLVNDPSRMRKRNEKSEETGIGHATVRRKNGQYFLPASGVRGALRAQARRIWQTLASGKAGDLNYSETKEVKRAGEQKNLPPLWRMLGHAGWKSPFTVPDFELQGSSRLHRQEFVAVDRFTGGSADEKKFSADGLYAPLFKGTISLDLARWRDADVAGWGNLLLLFLLRDLTEGDITFGFGASRGYGACTAQIIIRGDLSTEALDEWESQLGELAETAARP